MTSVRARSETPGQVGAPDLCRITVLARHTEVDLALPLDVPVALLLPGIVNLVAGHRPDNDFDATPERTEPDGWALARIGRAPLSGALSLDEHGVRDGEILVLEDAGSPAPPPLFDDVMYSVAASDRTTTPWGAGPSGLIAAVLGPVALAAGCVPLLFLPDGASRLALGAVCAALPLLVLLAAGILARLHDDRRTATALLWCAFPLAATAGALLVPGESPAPRLVLAAALTGAVAVLAVRATRIGLAPCTAVAATAAGVVVTATLASTTELEARALGAGTVVVALLLAGTAPRLAAMLAKLPIPPVPAPGAPLEPETPESSVSGLPSQAELEHRANRARSALTGIVHAVVLLTAGGAWCAAFPLDGDVSVPAVALAVASAVVLVFRGRTYTATAQAAPLVAGGAVLLLGLLVGAAASGALPPWAVFASATGLACAGFLFGVVAPRRTFTPVQRRIAEIAEYATIATVVPLACWVAGVYAAIRGL
ncbi:MULTISPECIES: type VII secretion integral membrane protein EccD [Rhodococcus]|uniref:type VII secretion integral membrane protein EccD n=1 Tax=Rhodococcus TaxID=1827 RepID=UPI00042A3081|nr:MULTISPECIES: type VII secretion integral membrane protein EccD [Rhodococcus]MCD2118456.1 type VII secretion integral membrane protein EccD [Rhodococcus pyridinivorans]MCD5422057.1 type VII secretion integral membrane protein EccD [Rhodococcus pyridinivorans]MCT7292303.1 type VII secretion integral membrane protein EccD [Rhodococcus sp. PAE-6]MCZ4627329.1 type VII secretion integral membrane protein EccD [Rhodococcus pyridinivorans]MCZ4648533.1 type VII secretion integral membrane protein E